MIYLPNDNFQYYYLHSNALFIIFPLKLYYFASKASAVSNVKPGANQWKVKLCNWRQVSDS